MPGPMAEVAAAALAAAGVAASDPVRKDVAATARFQRHQSSQERTGRRSERIQEEAMPNLTVRVPAAEEREH